MSQINQLPTKIVPNFINITEFITNLDNKFKIDFPDYQLTIHYKKPIGDEWDTGTHFCVVSDKKLLENDNFLDFQVHFHELVYNLGIKIYLCFLSPVNYCNLDESTIINR